MKDGLHEVDKVRPIQSIENRQACYVEGRCFHTEKGEVGQGDKVIVKDGRVEAKIEMLPDVDEDDL